MASLLIVDDERTAAMTLAALLRRDGHQTRTAFDGARALEALEQQAADIIITDLRMPALDGMQLLEAVRQRWPEAAVIVMTAFGDVQTAVQAMQTGASDFITKPLNIEAVRLRVRAILKARAVSKEVAHLQVRLADVEAQTGTGIVGRGPGIRQVLDELGKVAPTDANVLILGESGTGKELLARAIHAQSARAAHPFVQVHCAAFAAGVLESELFGHERGAFTGANARKIGRFELANGGTFFLDEVGDIPADTQIKLLRVLQERRFERAGDPDRHPLGSRDPSRSGKAHRSGAVSAGSLLPAQRVHPDPAAAAGAA